MEHYITIAAFSIGVTFLGIFTVIKSCDWLIGLKYKTKDECSKTRRAWEEKLKEDFAKKETVINLKEDMDELKTTVNDIHKIVLKLAMKDGE